MRSTFVIVLLFVAHSAMHGQNIEWSPDRKLTWNDFQATADQTSHFHAKTQSGVKYSYRRQSSPGQTKYTFEVFSYCDKSLSWVKRNRATPELLMHEQLHFDISELHARKFKQAIKEANFSTLYDTEISALFKENQGAREAMQEKYDRETQHMQNREEQSKWQQFIVHELQNLEKYAGSEVKI